VLFDTHDIGEAVYLGDRVSLMQDGAMSEPLAIDLPRPRSAALRYAAPFNALCAQLRQAMDEGTTHEA
jgi:NitT/TauT family transport system ATP-binding protein